MVFSGFELQTSRSNLSKLRLELFPWISYPQKVHAASWGPLEYVRGSNSTWWSAYLVASLDCLAKNIKDCIARFVWIWNGDIDFQRLIVTPQYTVILFPPKVQRCQERQSYMD